MIKNTELVEKIMALDSNIIDELSKEDTEALQDLINNDEEIQAHLCIMAKKYLKLIGQKIDADTLGNVLIKAGIDKDFYDKYLACEEK